MLPPVRMTTATSTISCTSDNRYPPPTPFTIQVTTTPHPLSCTSDNRSSPFPIQATTAPSTSCKDGGPLPPISCTYEDHSPHPYFPVWTRTAPGAARPLRAHGCCLPYPCILYKREPLPFPVQTRTTPPHFLYGQRPLPYFLYRQGPLPPLTVRKDHSPHFLYK